ncbi:MAG: hypothetical protein AB7Q23_08545 [Hyphomonadaceae bacterium]
MRVFTALIAAIWLVSAAPALAQPLPDTLRSAGVTQAQWDAIQRAARAQARRANISEASLLAAAEAATGRLAQSGRFNALSLQQTILDSLAAQAEEIADLQRRLEARIGDRDPDIAALYAQARAALEAGRLYDADGLLTQAAERDLAAMQAADAEAERRRLRAGESIASRGQIAFVQADYLVAAEHYARAANTVPQSATEPRWQYTMWRGRTLYERGRVFGEPEPLQQAIAAYESALTLRPRERAPADWAATQNDLGNALQLQGGRGAPAALQRAVAAYEAALTVRTRESDSAGWADTQMNLGAALLLQGERGSTSMLERAVAAYEAALTVETPESDPTGWAQTQMNLGTALRHLGERGVPRALERSVAAFEAALTVQTREADPAGWAAIQANLGVALQRRSERGAPGALDQAVAAYEAALTVMTREADPAAWARQQVNLGNALVLQGERGARGAFERAVAAFEAALTVETRESNPTGWARTQVNLGIALKEMGEAGAPGALERAVAVYDEALTVMTREVDPAGWAQAQYNLALAYGAMGRNADARAAAQRALEGGQQVGHRALVEHARRAVAAFQ